MVIAELFETGLFDMFLYFSEPYVWIPAYSCLVLGMIVQFILAKKCHKKVWRMSVLELGFIGILLCECIWHHWQGTGAGRGGMCSVSVPPREKPSAGRWDGIC